MRNYLRNDSLSKNNTNTKNSNFYDNSINSSNILTANHFYQLKELNTSKNINEKKVNSKTKNDNEISLKENKITGNNIKMYDEEKNKVIIHNKYLNEKEINPKLIKVNSEVELFQDYIIDDYKNQNINDSRNVIEKLGACVEKKYKTIKFWKNINNKNSRAKDSLSTRKKEVVPMYECDKANTIFLSKKGKHSFSTSHILDRKKIDSFPMVINSPLNYQKEFISCSQKERDEKNSAALVKLKHYLSMYWKQRKEIISEFFQKNNLYQNFFYIEKHLYNFANYINDNVFDDEKGTKCLIETRYPMIEIILKGINYKPVFNKKKRESNKNIINNIKLKNSFKRSETTDVLNREKEIIDYIVGKDKVEKFRNFLDRNYKTYVINKMLKRFSKEEQLIYFSGKKYGEIEIIDKKNLANNIHKQAFYQKMYDSVTNESSTKKSINYFNNDDLKKLKEELKIANDSIFNKSQEKKLMEKEKAIGIKNLRLNNKIINKLNKRLYYITKEKYHQNHPDFIPKKKQKLLEYVIAERIKKRNDFMDKFKQITDS